MATAERNERLRPGESDFDDGASAETPDDAEVECLDEDGAPIPRESGPVPRATHQGFSRARGTFRGEARDMPGASLPREGGLIAGKYRVEGVHARDSMVVTLKASHLDLGQRVWVRYLLPRATRRPDALARFMRSARTVATMRSEHAARVLDVGRIRSGIPFVVLDDMNGWDLDEVLRVRGALPVQEAVEYVLQAAEAVAEAHGLGLVHGSLRPSNILLARRKDESPLVKVVGFELSEVVDWTAPEDANDAGRAPSAFATMLPYLAPEQIRSADYVDERVDVWSLGAVLYALLCGVPPFRARTSAALLAAVAADEPRPVSEVRGDVAPDLEELVTRCLSKSPLDRPSSIAEVVQALTPFASGDGFSVIDRVSRMPLPSLRPPRLPVPPSRAIVPVARARTVKVEPVARAPSAQWLLMTALVGLGASVLGATAVIVAANAGSSRAARDAAIVQQPPAPVATSPAEVPAVPPVTQSSLRASPGAHAEVAAPAHVDNGARRVPADTSDGTTKRPPSSAQATQTASRPASAQSLARSDTRTQHATAEASDGPATPAKDLFGDTR